jgi:hypothetical protein
MRHALVAGFFVVLTAVFTYPLSLHPGSFVVPGDADTDLFMWTLAWGTHALFTRPWDLFEANIYYPQHYTLAYSENLVGSVPFAAPVLWLTGNPVLALNAVALSSVALCGIGAYLLARRLGASTSAAVLCGMIFAFSPSRFYRYGQIHLTTVQWIPFALAYLHAYFTGSRPRDLRIALAFFTLQVLATGHGAVYLVLAFAVVLLHELFVRRDPRLLLRAARDAGVPGLLILLPVAVLAVPYRIVQEEMGLRRSLQNWAAVPESFLASPAHLPARLNTWLAGMPVNDTATAFMFPGYLPLLLALAALPLAWRGRGRVVLPYLAITVLAVLLAAGPPISLWPHVYWMPVLNFIRVPSRFIILATLGVAVLAATGFDALLRARAAKTVRLVTVAAALFLVLEFATMPFTGKPYTVEIPHIDRWLATRPQPFAVAEIPVRANDRWHTRYMLHSMAHWQKTVHGHSGIRAALHDELYGQLREFPDDEGIANLLRLGVDYLVVHTDGYEPGEWADVERRLASYRDVLALEVVDGAGRIYSVHDPRRPPAQ